MLATEIPIYWDGVLGVVVDNSAAFMADRRARVRELERIAYPLLMVRS